MSTLLTPRICVIGAGSGGLSVASAASQLGISTVLIEKSKMGGDCLNYGCVPSKSLIAAAHAAHAARTSQRFGVTSGSPAADFPRVRDHIRSVIASIAPHDSQERFEGLGATVIRAPAKFINPREVEAGDYRIRARRFVVAVGSSPAVLPIPGLHDVPYLTNETVFENDVLPEHLLVLGGGPIGSELAQAHQRLGSKVTIIEMGRVLGRDDPDLAGVVTTRFRAEGIDVLEGTAAKSVRQENGRIVLTVEDSKDTKDISGSHLLVATGRRPNLEGLGLEEAGIERDRRGINVDAGLRTSNRRVYAIGDSIGRLQFTHMASYHAGIVIRRTLFRLPARMSEVSAPWVTYTDPEIAQVGLNEPSAREMYGDKIRVTQLPLSSSDRFRAEREEEGLVKVITKRGRVLGASMVGNHAGELIQPWCLMVAHRMKIGAMASTIFPYPTRGEINKQVAGAYFTPSLFNPRTRAVVRFLSYFG